MTTPVKDLPDKWHSETPTPSTPNEAYMIKAAPPNDELERLRGFVAELKRLTVHPFGYLTYNGICNLLKKHKLDGVSDG